MKWSFYYLYVILDVFSRYVTGWMIAYRETAGLAGDQEIHRFHANLVTSPNGRLRLRFAAKLWAW